MAHTHPPVDAHDAGGMRRSYVRVLLSWLAVLGGLYALQEYFSVR